MTSAAFYHFTVTPLLVGLPKLIQKICESQQKLLIVCRSEDEMNQLDNLLWTFSPKAFIPHCKVGEIKYQPALNPVLLALSANDNQNAAEVLLSLAPVMPTMEFQKQLFAFYGNANDIQSMMALYNSYKARTDLAELDFWKQGEGGKWLNTKSNSGST